MAKTKGAGKSQPKPKSAPKPAKKPQATKPSLPLPPAPPPGPVRRDELEAPHDIARLLRYGERFGPHKIDIRWASIGFAVTAGSIAIGDPTQPKSWRVLDRPSGAGTFRVMLSIAKERLAAIVIHVGRPPIARWTVAHARGQKKPKSADQLPRITSAGWIALADGAAPSSALAPPAATGLDPVQLDGALGFPCGKGDYAAYWAVDADDKPVCLVIDLDAFTQKEWKAKPTSASAG